MEKTLIFNFEDTNSNTTDKVVEIANTEDNLQFYQEFSGTTVSACTAFLENKGLNLNTSGGIIEGREYRVWDRGKIIRN